MAGIVPKAAASATLTALITALLANLKMRIFVNNITPDANTVIGDFTEATFTGYSAASLTTWSAPSIDGTGASISTTVQGQFTGTSGGGTGNMYGYYLTDSGGTTLYGCERFAGAPIAQAQNVVFQVTDTYSVITRF